MNFAVEKRLDEFRKTLCSDRTTTQQKIFDEAQFHHSACALSESQNKEHTFSTYLSQALVR